MSFGEKIASIMERPGQDPASKDDAPWWMKYGGRALGTIGGAFAIIMGALSCFGILFGNPSSLMAGLCQIGAGFFVMTVEAPCCCMFIDHVQNLSDFVDKRPYWNRAVAYCVLAVLPLFFVLALGNILATGPIFLTGIIYGMMSIGRKGSRADMAAMAASPSGMAPPPMGTVPSTDHHTTLMEDPDVWRPT